MNEDRKFVWRKPGPRFGGIPLEHDTLGVNVPLYHALPRVTSLARVGALSPKGLNAIARIWKLLKLEDERHFLEIEMLNRKTLEALIDCAEADYPVLRYPSSSACLRWSAVGERARARQPSDVRS